MGLIDFIFGRNKKNRESVESPTRRHERLSEPKSVKPVADTPKKQGTVYDSESSRNDNTADSSNVHSIVGLVNQCLELEAKGQIQPLQNSLFQLYGYFNKPNGGKYILNYPDKSNLALCFVFMLRYDWMHDKDIREVWAEDGLYSIIEHLAHQTDGQQGQAEAMIILFSLWCVGRKELKNKIQDILNRGSILGNPIFHPDDYRIGAQNVIDQLSLLAVSGVRALGPAGAQVMQNICLKFDGLDFFAQTIQRKDLMKYSPMDVFAKAKFIHSVIGSILEDM